MIISIFPSPQSSQCSPRQGPSPGSPPLYPPLQAPGSNDIKIRQHNIAQSFITNYYQDNLLIETKEISMAPRTTIRFVNCPVKLSCISLCFIMFIAEPSRILQNPAEICACVVIHTKLLPGSVLFCPQKSESLCANGPGLPLCQDFFSCKDKDKDIQRTPSQRLLTFETFDQSDEKT